MRVGMFCRRCWPSAGERYEFFVGEAVVVVPGGDQPAQEAAVRGAALGGGQLLHIAGERVGGVVDAVGPTGGEQLVRPGAYEWSIALGDAEEPADHGDGQWDGEVGDQVDVLSGLPAVGELLGQLLDAGPQSADGSGSEGGADQSAEPGMRRRVGVEHGAGHGGVQVTPAVLVGEEPCGVLGDPRVGERLAGLGVTGDQTALVSAAQRDLQHGGRWRAAPRRWGSGSGRSRGRRGGSCGIRLGDRTGGRAGRSWTWALATERSHSVSAGRSPARGVIPGARGAGISCGAHWSLAAWTASASTAASTTGRATSPTSPCSFGHAGPNVLHG